MRNWLSRLFGFKDKAPPRQAPARKAAPLARPESSRVTTPGARPGDADPVESPLSPAQIDFLVGLIDPPARRDLDEFGPDDRTFIGGIQKRLHQRELELPVFPAVAIRLSRMLREELPVASYVALLNQDPALSVEILKTANSAFYGGSKQMTTIQDAVVRVGLMRLQSILMISHLRAKVLKGGAFRSQAELLLEMALPMGILASKFASNHSTESDTCFMRGVLMHVEHLVIISAITTVSRDVRRIILPSVEALHQAFVRFGGEIRLAVATEWNLTDLLIGGEGGNCSDEYDLLRRALVLRWLRRPMPPMTAAWDRLETAMADIHPRIPEGAPQAAA